VRSAEVNTPGVYDLRIALANIFDAKHADYQQATITVLRSANHSSAVWLPVVN
jgi:hypothetical protein